MIDIRRNMDFFTMPAQYRVIPVNCRGVAGAGLAKAAKRLPGVDLDFAAYKRVCEDRDLKPGNLLIGSRLIFAATKNHWKDPSQLAWVGACFKELSKLKPDSIAIPALGCGLGGLTWRQIQPFAVDCCRVMQAANSEVQIYLFPGDVR